MFHRRISTLLILALPCAALQFGCGSPDLPIDDGGSGGGAGGGTPGTGGGSTGVGGGTSGTGGSTGTGGGTIGTGGGSTGTGGGTGGTGGGSSGSGGGTSGTGGGSAGGAGGAGGGKADAGHPDAGVGQLTIIVEPSDNAAALRTAIVNAKTSVHMTMYLLSSTSIINALIAQKNAGHDVKVLLNQNFPGGAGSNQSVFTQLQTAGVNVKWSPSNFTLTHEKCVIVDTSTAWIMTMNVTQTSPSNNREYLAVDTDPTDVAEAETIFQADFAGTTPVLSGTLLVAPVNPRPTLVAELNAATSRIDVEAEEISDYQIVNALAAARARGVQVHLVLSDNAPSSAQANAVDQLKDAGVSLVTLANPYVHAKSMVFDSARAYVGSENFTTGSLIHNRELGILFSAPAEVKKVLTTTNADFANGTAL